MPQPTLSSVHEDKLLTNISIAYMQDEKNFIADVVFPQVPVSRQSDKYRTYTKNDFMRDDMKKLAQGARSEETGYGLSTGSYSCDVWAIGHMIDEQERANYDQPGDPEIDATDQLSQLGMIRKERNWMSKYFVTGVWGTTLDGDAAGFTQFSNKASSDPETVVDTAKETVLTNTGMMPNTAVAGWKVRNALKQHPNIKESFKYVSSESISDEMLAKFFDVERFLVTKSSYASNEEGGTAAYSLIGGDHLLLVYSAPRPSLKLPSGGYTFVWSGLSGMNQKGVRVLKIPAPLEHSDKIEIQMAFDQKLVASDCGYMLLNAIA